MGVDPKTQTYTGRQVFAEQEQRKAYNTGQDTRIGSLEGGRGFVWLTDTIGGGQIPNGLINDRMISAMAAEKLTGTIGGTVIPNGLINNRMIGGNTVDMRVIDPVSLRGYLDSFYSAVGHSHFLGNLGGTINAIQIDNDRITDRMIAPDSVGDTALKSYLFDNSMGFYRLRVVSTFLGGNSGYVASANHGHSSGSSMNIDRIPVADRRRVLGYRKQLLDDLEVLRTLTVDELYIFVENLANVALDALSFAIDAPDIDADKRQALRDAGEEVPDNWEFREAERRAGNTPGDGVNEPNYFDTQPHYLGKIMPPSIRRANRPDTPKKAKI